MTKGRRKSPLKKGCIHWGVVQDVKKELLSSAVVFASSSGKATLLNVSCMAVFTHSPGRRCAESINCDVQGLFFHQLLTSYVSCCGRLSSGHDVVTAILKLERLWLILAQDWAI